MNDQKNMSEKWTEAFNKAFDAHIEKHKSEPFKLGVVRQIASKMDNMLRSDNPGLNGHVVINHRDGSHFFFNNSFYKNIDSWIIVFTEHNGAHVFYKDDLDYYF